MNYGEDVRHPDPTFDSFDIVRPTIELPLDEILMETGDCSEACTANARLSLRLDH